MQSPRTFSLRARLTWLLAFAVLVAIGGAAWVMDQRADHDMRQRFDVSVLARAQSLAAAFEAEHDRSGAQARASLGVFPGTTGRNWYVLRCDGGVVAHSAEALPESPAGATPRFHDVHVGGHALRAVTLRLQLRLAGVVPGQAEPGDADCTLHYAVDRGPLERLLHNLDAILLLSLMGACVLVLVTTPWLVARGLRPLSGLAQAMADIGPDAPGGRLPASRTTELVPLVARFNEVLARMDAGLARERQFAAGVAHEFRTRLAELRTLVDVERRYPSGRPAAAVLDEVGHIGAELEATVTALLQLTRIQSGLEAPRPERVPLTHVLERVRARGQEAAEGRGVRIDSAFGAAPDFTVEADPAMLEIVLGNLLGNAVAYAPAGSTVTLRADARGVAVGNAAPGLHPEDLAHFGQRFWRKDAQGSGHAGLGLALAGAAARALRMTLAFALEDGVLRATLTWRG